MSARPLRALALSITLGAASAVPAVASDGEPDSANAHPAVGFYHVAYTRADASVETLGGCSGTLIADDVFLTAGHCTFYDSRLLHEDKSYVAAQAWVTLDPVALDNDFRCFLQDVAFPGAGELDCDGAARVHLDFHRASVGAAPTAGEACRCGAEGPLGQCPDE